MTPNYNEHRYLSLLDDIMEEYHEGEIELRNDRTGTSTISVFGERVEYALTGSFPLLTTKKVYWKGVVAELLWFISGDTNNNTLKQQNVHIWDEWEGENGELGPIYGKQWRDFNGVDQLLRVQQSLREDPYSRRHIVSAWNPAEVDNMALPPCHTMFQFYVDNHGRLDCQLYQRSADLFLGVPFNIASYSLLTLMMAQTTGLQPGRFVHTIGDAHIYSNHVHQVSEQLNRKPSPAPTVSLNPLVRDITEFTIDDIDLIGYDPHPAIKAPVAV